VNAKIQTYVPLLVQRSVAATLRELARTEGTSADLLPLVSPERVSA
jgi:predicted RecB family endonuclease